MNPHEVNVIGFFNQQFSGSRNRTDHDKIIKVMNVIARRLPLARTRLGPKPHNRDIVQFYFEHFVEKHKHDEFAQYVNEMDGTSAPSYTTTTKRLDTPSSHTTNSLHSFSVARRMTTTRTTGRFAPTSGTTLQSRILDVYAHEEEMERRRVEREQTVAIALTSDKQDTLNVISIMTKQWKGF